MRAAAQFIHSRSPVPMSGEVTEDQLRTYMANGTDPAELEAVVEKMQAGEELEAAALVPVGADLRPGGMTRV